MPRDRGERTARRQSARAIVLAVAVAASGCGTVSDDQGGAHDADGGAGGYERADAAEPTDAAEPADGGSEKPELCAHDQPFGPPEPVLGVNSEDDERCAWLSADERTIVFTRLPAGGGGGDLYGARRTAADGAFDKPAAFDELNTDAREYRASMSADRKTIFFDRVNAGAGWDIMVASRSAPSAKFGPASLVADVNQEETSDNQPFVTAGGMYFVSYRTGVELQFAPASGGGFGAPEPLDSVVSAQPEAQPVPSADGGALYFAAQDRAPGGAGWDVWVAIRGAGDEFETPTLVAGLVNDSGNQAPSWLSPDNCRLYFFADTGGDYDLWVATRAGTASR